MRKLTYALLTILLFVSLAVPVWADDGEGEVVFPGGSVVIGPEDELDGDLTVMGGSVELREGGCIRGDVVVLSGQAIVDGRIDGNLVVIGGTLDLQSHAVINENLVTFGASVSRAEGAIVHWHRIEGFFGQGFPLLRTWRGFPGLADVGRIWRGEAVFNLLGFLVRTVFSTLALMALGVLLVLFLPKQTALLGQTVSEAPLPSIGVGLLTFIVLLILVPLLVVICIGIPVALLLVLAAVAAGIFGWIAIGVLIGQRLLAALQVAQPQPLLEVIVGIPVITLLSAVPCLGWLLALIVASAGLGAVVLTRFGTMAYEPLSKAAGLPGPPSLATDVQSAPEEQSED